MPHPAPPLLKVSGVVSGLHFSALQDKSPDLQKAEKPPTTSHHWHTAKLQFHSQTYTLEQPQDAVGLLQEETVAVVPHNLCVPRISFC